MSKSRAKAAIIKTTHNQALFSLLSLRGLRVFMNIWRQASSTGYFLTDLRLLKLMEALVFPISSFRIAGAGVCFSTTMVANILLISSVFFSISTSRRLRYSSSVVHRHSNSWFRCSSFSQLSLAIRINSLRQLFSRRMFFASFSRIYPRFLSRRCLLARSLFSPILASRAWLRSCSELRMKVSAPRSCVFFMRSFSSSRTTQRFRCYKDSQYPFISRSICWAWFRLPLSSTSPASGLLTFSDNRSRSTMAMGVERPPSQRPLSVSSKQMGREESNSSTDGSQEDYSSKGFSIQQLIIIMHATRFA